MGGVLLAFVAGGLSVFSPCVLPLLPIVLGTAASEGRYGPAALAFGMALSFVVIGLFIALAGFSIGLDQGFFRSIGSVLLVMVGAVLIVPALQNRVAVAAGPVSGWIDNRMGGIAGSGPWGQFGVGALLGAVWTPCVGPTLGAASLLAAQGENLGQVALTMLAFGIGAALPLVILGMLSRELLLRWRSRMMNAGKSVKTGLGVLLMATGLLIILGLDKQVEAKLVNLSPAWLTALTTRY